jgi:hypothetical protein
VKVSGCVSSWTVGIRERRGDRFFAGPWTGGVGAGGVGV